MYEFYNLGQTWARLWVKGFEPVFNNPMMDWYMDQYTQAMLNCWFWHGPVVAMEEQFNDFAKLLPLGNICKPR